MTHLGCLWTQWRQTPASRSGTTPAPYPGPPPEQGPLGPQPGRPPPGWEPPHWCPRGQDGQHRVHLTGGQSRPHNRQAAHPGHQPYGDRAALLCPAERLLGTELPELEHGCPSPEGRPQECSISGLGVGEGQGRPALRALDSNNRGSSK